LTLDLGRLFRRATRLNTDRRRGRLCTPALTGRLRSPGPYVVSCNRRRSHTWRSGRIAVCNLPHSLATQMTFDRIVEQPTAAFSIISYLR
jgi:hypothetical protein